MGSGNNTLSQAKKAKQDEFYTQFADIQKEMNAYLEFNSDVFRGKTVLLPCDDPEWSNFTKFFALNFETFGLKKLISTSYAFDSKKLDGYYAPSLFEQQSPKFDAAINKSRGKLFIVDRDITGDGKIDIDDLHWTYLEGDGDFRSDEVKRLRDEADIIVTNPPFSLFREFLAWILEAGKRFILIGNKNVITYKEVFPLIKDNKMWVGTTPFSKDMLFIPPTIIDPTDKPSTATRTVDGVTYLRSPAIWLTNIEHGRRHRSLSLMTMADNIKFSRHKEVRGIGYLKYDNYNAIEVPFSDAIPADYNGVMGVPISFMDKYCPEQFEILDARDYTNNQRLKAKNTFLIKDADGAINGKPTYARILIRFSRAGGGE